MNRKQLILLLVLLSVLLAAELTFVGVMHVTERNAALQAPDTDPYVPGTLPTEAPTEATGATEAPTEAPTEATEAPTEEVTEPTETEPEEQRYTLTFVGDCTLGSMPKNFTTSSSFVQTIGEDYDFPFRHVADIFKNDDFTMINLESVLADEGSGANKTFVFRGPTAYTNILTGSSVEAVTLANNHTMDFGKAGYDSTREALEGAGVAYVEQDNIMLFTTESGLTIGVYAACFTINEADMRSDIAKLRNQGAEIVIAALHWGLEGKYRPNSSQEQLGRAAIDAGADIVYGHHPHVLQKIEEYKDGIIFYSLGNFSFGGNTFPRDRDSAILQQEILRDENGRVSLGELTIIPVSISSMAGQNNFQPIPYEEGTEEYKRTMSKLDGTFKGADLVVDYSFMDPTESTEATQPGGSDTETPPETQPDSGSGDAGGDTGSDAGSDSGSDAGGDAPAPPPPGDGEG